jgi:hypothetical protein
VKSAYDPTWQVIPEIDEELEAVSLFEYGQISAFQPQTTIFIRNAVDRD